MQGRMDTTDSGGGEAAMTVRATILQQRSIEGIDRRGSELRKRQCPQGRDDVTLYVHLIACISRWPQRAFDCR